MATREIPLTNGFVAVIDACFFEMLSQWNWRALKNKKRHYATRKSAISWSTVYMHRELMVRILGRKLSKCEQVDHINGNGLDNRSANLRIATQQQQNMNRRKLVPRSSKFKGVHFVRMPNCKLRKPWRASIRKSDRTYHLGLYETELDAAIAYNTAACTLFGAYAHLNDTPQG